MAFDALPNVRGVRYSHTPAYADRRTRYTRVTQGKARPAANVDDAAAAQNSADHLQAEYFVRLLTQSRQLIDHRIAKYQKAIASAQASGDVENVPALRRMARIEEKDRQGLSEMIDHLERRFQLRDSGGVPHISRRTRPVVR
jgi:hypothetical protein